MAFKMHLNDVDNNLKFKGRMSNFYVFTWALPIMHTFTACSEGVTPCFM